MKGAPTINPCCPQSSVRLLLDTHALFWWDYHPRRLPNLAQALIGDPANDVFVSPVSAWEITNKFRKGKWPEADGFARRFAQIVRQLGFAELPITFAHATKAGSLDARARDPFDRLLAGQALMEDLRFVTADAAFHELGVAVVWNDAST